MNDYQVGDPPPWQGWGQANPHFQTCTSAHACLSPLWVAQSTDLVRRFEELVLEKADLERRLAEALSRIEELVPRDPLPENKGW